MSAAKHAVRNKRESSASERANGRARGPVLTSGFLVVLDHSATDKRQKKEKHNADGVRDEKFPSKAIYLENFDTYINGQREYCA